MTTDQIARLQVPMLFVSAPQIKTAATLIPVRQNGPVRIWQTRDGAQIATRDGLVVATHGLGFDLAASDLDGIAAAIAGGPGEYKRTLSHIMGDLRTSVQPYRCVLAPDRSKPQNPAITVLREDCRGPDPFRNLYHIDAKGRLFWSQQWVSPKVGHLEIEVIRPDK
ncbi:YjbF family lipoprotein [Yoonia sp.]|uniref:YjbF family lipoprotein n=1 Tax=Yoonia sp. TaxID=2212373 RepID=UPI0025D006B1|nr:YjbF family lipoprotein [Yoonia sp.]